MSFTNSGEHFNHKPELAALDHCKKKAGYTLFLRCQRGMLARCFSAYKVPTIEVIDLSDLTHQGQLGLNKWTRNQLSRFSMRRKRSSCLLVLDFWLHFTRRQARLENSLGKFLENKHKDCVATWRRHVSQSMLERQKGL